MIPVLPWAGEYTTNGWRICDDREIIGLENNFEFAMLYNKQGGGGGNHHIQTGSRFWGKPILSLLSVLRPDPAESWIFVSKDTPPVFSKTHYVNAQPLPLP